MDIRYIRSNFSKLGPDHLYKFLLDIITRGDFDKIENYDITKSYVKGSKVYYFRNNTHHIYECITDISTDGAFVDSEWADIIDVFRGMTGDDILNKMFITEEIFTADKETNKITIQYDGYDPLLCKIIPFHSIQGRLSETEYTLNDNVITLNDIVMNAGEYMIIDIYEYDNKIHNDLLTPKGYVYIKFVDASGVEIKKSITYMGDIGSTCDVYPALIDGYDYISHEGELDGVFDTEVKNITFKYNKK